MTFSFYRGFAAVALLAVSMPLVANAQTLVFNGVTDQGEFIYVDFTPGTVDSPGFGSISASYAMRCSGGKVRYRSGGYGGDAVPDADNTVRLREWSRDTRMTGEIVVAPDGQSATGSFTIAHPMIRDVGRTSEFVSRCTSGKVGFTAQLVPTAAPSSTAPR